MRVEVRVRGVESSSVLRNYASRRIRFHLSRFGNELSAIVVHISDLNGPKGGLDKQCRVTIRGRSIGCSTLDERSNDTQSAIDLAVERTARVLARELERVRESRVDGRRLFTSGA